MIKLSKLFTALLITVLATNSFAQKGLYKIDAAKSSIEWFAKKVTGAHNGIVQFQSGVLATKGGKLAAGTFVVNMASIKTTDIQGEYADKLDGHLKADDFFGVEKNPTATFKITKIGKEMITGDMTIKGIKQAISFPAKVELKGDMLTASGKLTIDRTKFDIKYNSKSVFTSIGDKAIDDDFVLDIKIVANK